MPDASLPLKTSSRRSDDPVDVLGSPAYAAYLSLEIPRPDGCEPLTDFDRRFLGEAQGVQSLINQMLEMLGWQAQLDQLQRSSEFGDALVWDRSALETCLRQVYFIVDFKGSTYVFQR